MYVCEVMTDDSLSLTLTHSLSLPLSFVTQRACQDMSQKREG